MVWFFSCCEDTNSLYLNHLQCTLTCTILCQPGICCCPAGYSVGQLVIWSWSTEIIWLTLTWVVGSDLPLFRPRKCAMLQKKKKKNQAVGMTYVKFNSCLGLLSSYEPQDLYPLTSHHFCHDCVGDMWLVWWSACQLGTLENLYMCDGFHEIYPTTALLCDLALASGGYLLLSGVTFHAFYN